MNSRMKALNRKALPIVWFFLMSGTMAFTEDAVLKMSTTTSTESSGLLDVLLPAFEKSTGIRVEVIAKGTGAAIRDGMDGNVDVIFVHAKNREEAFVKNGYGTRRYAVMHNDFIIAGPSGDPAHIKGEHQAAEAFRRIAKTKSLFVSRGDDSGTHTKEQEIWKLTGLDLDMQSTPIVKEGKKTKLVFTRPKGSSAWYISIGQGMGKTLTFAEEKQAYVLTDRGTFIKYKYDRPSGLDLDILCEGDPLLINPYGVIPVNPKIHPHARYDLAEKFALWLISPEGQSLIERYRVLGKQLFSPDAAVPETTHQ